MSIGNLKDSGNLGNNFPWQLKMLQGLQGIYDEVKKPLTCLEDSVAVCAPLGGFNVNLHDGTGNPITSTVNGPDRGIDVNIINALPLEINLDPGNDSVGIYGYTNIADPNSFTGIKVNASGQLDIRPLTCVDKLSLCFNNGVSDVTVSSTNPLPVNATITIPNPLPVSQDSGSNPWIVDATGSAVTVSNTVTVQATALDIRPLTCATDSIKICEGGNDLGVGADGSINVNLVDSTNGTQAVVNSDGTQNNAIYGYDHTSLQNEQITSVGISATVQALDVNIANSVPTLDVAIVNPLGVQSNCDNAVSTALCQTQEDILTDIKTAAQNGTAFLRTTGMIRPTGSGNVNTAAATFYSVSVANVGLADGTILTGITIRSGEVLNFSADAVNNYFNSFAYNASGTEFIIIFVY